MARCIRGGPSGGRRPLFTASPRIESYRPCAPLISMPAARRKSSLRRSALVAAQLDVVRDNAVVRDKLLAECPCLLARRFRRKTAQQRKQRLDVPDGAVRTARKHALDHSPPQSGGAIRAVEEADLL